MPRHPALSIAPLAIVLAILVVFAFAPLEYMRAATPENQAPSLAAAAPLRGYDLLTSQDGWALRGEQLYATHTGGESWREITPPNLGRRSLSAVHFLDARRGWALLAGAGETEGPSYALAVTGDGGVTWRVASLPLLTSGDLDANMAEAHLFFIDPSAGWLVLRRATGANFDVGDLFRTMDGGETWTRLSIPIGDAVYFATRDDGWVAGGAAGDELYRTRDGGVTWERQDVPGEEISGRRAYGLPRFEGGQRGQIPVVLSEGESSRVAFYMTRDGGDTWQLAQEVPLEAELPAGAPLPLSLIDGTRWSLVLPGDGRVLGTSQGGGLSSIPSDDSFSAGIVALDMVMAQTGWGRYAAGSCVPSVEGLRCMQETRLLRTKDGGRTWAALPLPGGDEGSVIVSTVSYSGASAAGTYLTQPIVGQAFDSCTLPSVSQMRNWFVNSPYRAWNLYIGGSSRGNCGNLTASHIAQLAQQGWRLIPTWVGPQASCTTFAMRMSADPAIAYAEGVSEANQAIAVASSLGLTRPDGTGTMIYYDLEAYDVANQACRNAASSFIAGWSAQLRARGHKAGVYGSACSSALADFSTNPVPPDGVWIAAWIRPYEYRPEATVWDVPCLADSLWPNQQRLRQYSGGHDETWGGLTLNIDSSVLDGIVAALNPPHVPANPNPADGSIAPRSLTLSWSGSDPDPGDSVSYRVYLEANASPIASLCEGPSTTCEAANLSPNTDYYWRVVATDQRGMTSSSPIWHFRTAAVANDDLGGALAISALPYSNVQDTTAASVAVDDPVFGCVTARKYNTVWYRYTSTSDVSVEISTVGSSYDTVLAAWSGERGALDPVACNDDAEPGQTGAKMRFAATAGTPYLIEVAGYRTGGGTLRLSVAEGDLSTTVGIDPLERSVSAGQEFTVGLRVADVVNLGSCHATMGYEPALVRVEAVTQADFLGSTGRLVTERAPVVDNAAGRATFGAYTTGALPAGPHGTGILAWVRLRGLGQGTAHLRLEGVEAADVTGKALPVNLRDGAALIVPCEGDLDGDGEVGAEDIQSVAYRWNSQCGQPTYNGFYDLDSNCRIDIADLQRVAGRWGVRCAGSGSLSAIQVAPGVGTPGTPRVASATVIMVQPAGQVVSLGQTFTVQIAAAGAMNLGAMEFSLRYDAERLELLDVQPGEMIGSTGRSATAMGPMSDAKAGAVTYGLYSVGNGVPGPSGNGVLARVIFRARRVGQSGLVLQHTQVTDITGAPAAVLVQDGDVTVADSAKRLWLLIVKNGRW